MLVLGDYSFLQDKIGVIDKLIWKCSEYKDSKCISPCHAIGGARVKNTAVHNHNQY